MINSLSIRNFKGLDKFDLQDISRINLLGGKNNAGKTTILEALFMFYDRLNPNMILRQYNWRGVTEMSASPDMLLAPIFHNFNLENDIQIEVRNHMNLRETLIIKYRDNSNQVVKMKSSDGQIKTDESITGIHSLDMTVKSSTNKEQKINLILDGNGIAMEFKEARQPDAVAVFLAAKSHSNPNENAIHFGKLDVKGKSDVIVDFLRIIEPRLKSLSSVTMPNNTSMLHGDIGIGIKVPITYMGDGISRLLTILLSIVSNRNSIIFIDEIENGIHYSVLNKVWEVISKAAVEYNCQIFATTHSYECLNAAIEGVTDEKIKEDFRYFRIERSEKEGKLIPRVFNYEVLKTAIEQSWEVR